MKKLLVLGLLLGFSSGCDGCSRNVANWRGHSTMCVDGVVYIQFASGASVGYNTDGTIKTCK